MTAKPIIDERTGKPLSREDFDAEDVITGRRKEWRELEI